MAIFIEKIKARQIIDSRGIPTLSVETVLSDGTKTIATVPSGASKGAKEAVELRDYNPNYLFSKSVLGAKDNVNSIIFNNLKNQSPFSQFEIDKLLEKLDGSSNFKNLGANATLGTSLSICEAASKSRKIELFEYIGGMNANILPIPMINIINGGAHSNNNLDFQEFMIVPLGYNSFKEAIEASLEVFNKLKEILKKEGKSISTGDEGGFGADFNYTNEAIDYILDAIEKSNHTTNKIKLALDCAANEMFYEDKYHIDNRVLESEEMVEYLKNLSTEYPIISIEDGLNENDIIGWKKLTTELSNKIMLVGDDIFTTNVKSLTEGIRNNIANAILIKPNQIGTLTKTLECVKLAKNNCYKTIISHRSGETESTFIADLAVGLNAGFIKTGSLSRSERCAKYNRLLYIEDYLGQNARYFGNCLKII